MIAEWTFPADVKGWLTEEEGRALAELARGRRVLEIGSFEGRSTVCLAQTAEHVTAVDPLDGRATPENRDTGEALLANLERYEVAARVAVHRGTSRDVLPALKTAYDLVFIDGAHDYASVCEDIDLALARLKPDGLLAFHDYRTRPGECDGGWDPGVTAAVHKLIAGGARLLSRHGSLAVVQPAPAEETPAARRAKSVYLAVPTKGSVIDEAIPGLFRATADPDMRVNLRLLKTGMVALNFNSLWAEALDGRRGWETSHWAMHHADVESPPGWLDLLLEEMERVAADVLSVVIPIKDERGLTTTAVGDARGGVLRRLTLREVYDLPETFCAQDMKLARGEQLLCNTGLWVCRFDQPWVEPPVFPGFYFTDGILKMPDGTHQAAEISEDWNFSAWANRMRLRVFATRKVPVIHHGGKGYTNAAAWGLWDKDLGDQHWQDAMRAKRKR